ncbi:hypothetical protein F4778DRAFT_770105 [Xylariomycetidae sp. FL2044]|nr:hypothetical protein F4778DRAFT_770105 [Xylariomycetidae sp. FL2044]
MWPFSTYPEARVSDVDGKTYDYIVVGGGTAGCCLASRLSEDPSVSVLLIEKGHVKDNLVSRMPLLSQNIWLGSPLQVQGTRFIEPMPDANGRINRLWTAEGLGGASRINAMLLTRGVPAGYNEWAEKYGLDEWTWDQVEPYFKKSENALAHADSNWRGHNGPIKIKQSFPSFQWAKYMEKAARELGLPVENDYNNPSAPVSALFRLDITIDENGRRVSAYRAFLNKDLAVRRRKHLTVCTGAVASRLDIDGQSGRVRGVNIRSSLSNTAAATGDTFVVARREVIISSGALGSPLVLMRSGIGLRDQLEPLDIAVKNELPVGATLQDHCSFAIMLDLPRSETLSLLESLWGLWHMLLWLFLGTGLFAVSSTPQSVFIRTADIDDQTMTIRAEPSHGGAQSRRIPDAEIMLQPVNSFERHIPGRSLMSLFPTLLQPQSVGTVEIVDNDPLTHPRVNHPMLQDSQDLVPIRRAIRFAMRLAEEFQKSGYPYAAPLAFAPGVNLDALSKWEANVPNTLPKEYAVRVKPEPPLNDKASSSSSSSSEIKPKSWRDVTDDEIDDYARRVGMVSLHVACTCPMSRDRRSGVVDQRLRVHGIPNLRVADASVFPKIPSGHTMGPTIMVAERCADFIKESWAGSNEE